MVVAAAGTPSSTPRRRTIDICLNLVPVTSIFLVTPTRGDYGKHYYYEQDKFHEKIFLGPCGAKDPGNITARKFHSTKHKTMLFIYKKKCPARQGGLRVFRLTLEPLGYGARSIFNANPGGFRRFFNGPLHHEIQGDAGVTALEANQHVLDHWLCQSMALHLQMAADSLLQSGYLCPGRVKQWEHGASFWCHVPGTDKPEAEGQQGGILLAQEATDTLCLTSVRSLEILQPLPGDSQLLHLLLHELSLPRHQASLLVPQIGLPTISIELIGFPLYVKVGLTMVEGGLTGAQDLMLAMECDVVQLLPL
jgi:hypothetical protein